jgi:hypothetical protein
MPATWKTVRVFISSTFRDMHSERDYLVRVLIPDLRERLERHRVHLKDIGLRWGVAQEQTDNDRVLDLRLEQIAPCRPLFVGLLGQRYGWGLVRFAKTDPSDATQRFGAWRCDNIARRRLRGGGRVLLQPGDLRFQLGNSCLQRRSGLGHRVGDHRSHFSFRERPRDDNSLNWHPWPRSILRSNRDRRLRPSIRITHERSTGATPIQNVQQCVLSGIASTERCAIG